MPKRPPAAALSAAPPKRRRPFSDDDAKLAAIYENLASEVGEHRLSAARDLVARLAPANNPAPGDVDAALTRLVRGLCSGRKAARFGFSIALTELLRQVYGAGNRSLDDLLAFVERKTRVDSQVSGQEKRDHQLGEFFGYKAIAQSAILWQPHASPDSWAIYLRNVLRLARASRWIRDKCGLMLCEVIKSQQLHESERKNDFVKLLVQNLAEHGLAKTPEGVAIWLAASSVCGQSVLPGDVWKENDPLSTKERQNLIKLMKGCAVADPGEGGSTEKNTKSQTGYSMPTPSFAWDVILSSMLTGKADDQAESTLAFSKFWLDVVDNNLFSSSASHERKAWGFHIFANVISSAPRWAIPPACSPNLMRSLINQRKGADRYLHQAALAPLKEMQSRVAKDASVAAVIVEQLTSNHGTIDFDHITKTKTLDSIVSLASETAMVEILAHLDRFIRRPSAQDDMEADRERRLVADILVAAARNRSKGQVDPSSIKEPGSWLHAFFQFFVKHGYFMPNVDDAPFRPPMHEATRNVFRTRLLSCLTHFASSKVDEDGLFAYFVVTSIRDLSKSSKTLDLVFQADHDVLKIVKRAHKTQDQIVSAMESAGEQNQPAYRALKLMWSQTLLQVYNGDPDAVSILDELSEIQKPLLESSSKEEGGFDLLLEILLSFMSKPSALSRMLSEEVFSAFTGEVTEQSLQSLIDILEKRESIKGQEDLFDREMSGEEPEDDEAEDEDSITGEDASDVEMVNGDLEEAINEEDTSEDEEDEEESDSGAEDESGAENGDEDDEVLQFEAKLAEALGTSKLGPDDSDDEESSDEDMDDEQMMALDGHLAKIFKERKGLEKNQKKERQNAKETVINFKNRVLDLLLIYIKQQHTNPLALHLVLPLIRLIRTTASKQIAERSFELLKKYFDSCKGKDMPALDSTQHALTLLHDIHQEVSESDSKMHGAACTRASLFVGRILIDSDDKQAYSKIASIYAETQERWYSDPKSNIQLSFFQQWLNWSNDLRKQRSGPQKEQQEQQPTQNSKAESKQSPEKPRESNKGKKSKNKGKNKK